MDIAAETTPRPNNSLAMNDADLARQRGELADIIDRHCATDGTVETAVPGLKLFRGSSTDAPTCTIIASVFAIMAQGAKRLAVGEDTFDYDARHYLISSVDLPIFSRITCASIGEPYLGLALNIDLVKINELAAEMSKNRPLDAVDRGIGVGMVSLEIHNTALRLQPDCSIRRMTFLYWRPSSSVNSFIGSPQARSDHASARLPPAACESPDRPCHRLAEDQPGSADQHRPAGQPVQHEQVVIALSFSRR